MIKTYTSNDMISVYVAALRWAKAEDDSNPGVGIGPSMESLLDSLIEETGVELTPFDYDLVITKAEEPRRY